jgi:DNA repair protein RecO (recombination protein O)
MSAPPAPSMQTSAHRVALQAAYLLHHRPYRDSSRILELFTREFGRVTVFARGTRGGKKTASTLGAVLQPFHRVLVSWSMRGEAGQLTGAEFDGAYVELPPARMMSGYYLNELLLRLFERNDAHAEVFDLYDDTLSSLKQLHQDEAVALRRFEKRLLDSLGYGLALTHDHAGNAIEPQRIYRYRVELGAVPIDGVADAPLTMSGQSLLAIATDNFIEQAIRIDARNLFRAALEHYLEGRGLRSREVLAALRRMN